jgi:AP-1 complex subunit gamma-1
VALTLSVLSEICTAELSKEIAPMIITIISNASPYIKKKAILTSTKIIRRSPEFISEFMPKIEAALDEKQHGVLLGAMGFLETALVVDESQAPKLAKLVPKIGRVYRSVVTSSNPEYETSGTNDPFLQVSIIRFLRYLYKVEKSVSKEIAEILMAVHDFICTGKNAISLKNGSNAVLFECFQAMISLELTPQLKDTVVAMVSKFVTVKDANSKYLTLYILNLLSKCDLNAVQNHRSTIYECLNENDILIRTMALDLLYIIATPENVFVIVKDLLNTLLNASDDEFVAELSLKICLIVDKQSPSRRWYFDTILKVLILAGHSVKEESISSLVHLMTATPQLQSYAMIKLFFSATENP